jgi:hypothetical protein
MPDTDEDDDLLEGEIDGSAYDPDKHTEDDDVIALVLFGDVDWTDPDAVERRQQEWEALGGLQD